MRSFFARWGLIYPVHLLRREWILPHRAEIEELSKLSKVDMQRWQETKLIRLLTQAFQNDPYYQKLLKPYVQYFNQPLEWFNQIPLLTKEIIREEESRRNHSFCAGLDQRSTSGSTGSPFVFWKDRLATGFMQALQDQAFSWYGLSVGEPQARFWGLPAGKAGRIALLKDFLKHRIRFSAFKLGPQDMLTFYQRLLTFKPTYFYGYPSLVLEFARFVQSERLPLNTIPLKVVIGTGENITQNERDELHELLGVPFASEYGCSEVGVIGFECPYGRMHVMAQNIYIELIDSIGNLVPEGEEGEVVVTELNSRYLPFIRYRLGDRAKFTKEQCPCGNSLPVFEVLAGRRDDYIITPEGRKVYDAILAYTLKKGIVQFKAVQLSTDKICIYIRPGKDFTAALEQQYIEQLKQSISPLMRIEFILVKEIERERSGKMRYFRSEIRSDPS